jgi:biopolymer transport protein TolQ
LELISATGLVVKLVLLILIGFSLLSWAIIFLKFRVIYRAISDSQQFQHFFWNKRRLDAINKNLGDFPNAPTAALFRDGYQELMRNQRDAGAEEPAAFSADMGHAENVARALRRATTQETQRLERYLPFLATTGSTAPFIGLFGTVWGIMDSFHEIGKTGSASLAVVAPGISEALVATAIGLVAAIPAVVAYNHFISTVNVLTGDMDSFSQEFLNIVGRMARRS